MELLFLGLSALVLILFPAQTAEGAIEGIRLCGSALIPSLLPFLMIMKLIGSRIPEPKPGRLWHGRDPMIYLPYGLSFLGGYPSGVATTVSFYKQGKLTKEDAQALIPYCNNSGPGFFMGVLGYGVFRDPVKGLLLYGIHVLCSVLLFSLCYRPNSGKARRRRLIAEEKVSFPKAFQEALAESCNTMLRICGLVILFSVIRNLLGLILPHGLLRYMGILEISSGVLNTGADDFVLWAFFMGWGGVCVHLQSMSIWQEAGLKVKGYFGIKLLHGLLSGLCGGILFSPYADLGVGIFVVCCVFFFFLKNWGRKTEKNRL